MQKLFTQNIAAIVYVIAIAIILRVVPHPPNFAPIGAMALFGGAYLDRKYALVIPLGALFLSDVVIGFHSTMVFVYGSFILTGLMGMALKHYITIPRVFGASLLSSILFFLITNFGVWVSSGIYQLTSQGLIDSYVMAIPFFKNTLIGDMFYTTIFFGSYEVLTRTLFKSTQRELKI